MNTQKALQQFNALLNYDKPLRLAAEKWKAEWQKLIATLLSARTRDDTTIPVAKELFKKYPTCKQLANASEKDVQKIIRPVNFYKTKTKNVLGCAKMLHTIHKGKPPHNINALIKLPGVGRKTANVFLSEQGYDAIGVDTHVSQISQTLGWTKNKHPDKIEEDLKKLFPQDKWQILNPILVRFGRNYTRKEKKEILEKIIDQTHQ